MTILNPRERRMEHLSMHEYDWPQARQNRFARFYPLFIDMFGVETVAKINVKNCRY